MVCGQLSHAYVFNGRKHLWLPLATQHLQHLLYTVFFTNSQNGRGTVTHKLESKWKGLCSVIFTT